MLALGRAIIAEPTTNPQNESFPKKLTSFIEDLADLQLAYQNWYDELHGGLQQSKNLSDQLGKFASGVNALEPACNNILPATITMDNLESELKALQVCGYMESIFYTIYEGLVSCALTSTPEASGD